jgi:putative ABC transport system permease protein
MMAMPAVISWQAIGLGAALSAITGIAAGVIPARRAASLLPVDALR